MFESIVKQNRFLLGYAGLLMSEIDDARMAEQPIPGMNHAAWILGHITYTADLAAYLLGDEKKLPKSYEGLFGRGTEVQADRSVYPSKEELLSNLNSSFARTQERLALASPERLSGKNPNKMIAEMLPTLEDLIFFLMTGHFSIHLGQLSAWRKALGMPPMF